MKIALIGNGRMFEPDAGDKINRFDRVARINEYKIKGYENLVGTKTDLWILGGTRNWEWSDCPSVWLCYPYGVHKQERAAVEPHLKDRVHGVDIKNIAQVHQQYGSGPWMPHPTTGLIAMAILSEMYGKIYIAGFDGMVDGIKHYDGTEGKTIAHLYKNEAAFIRWLFDNGRVEWI